MKMFVSVFFAFTLLVVAPVHAQSTNFGATPYTGGVSFRVWAPNATTVHVAGEFNDWHTSNLPLSSEGGGVWARNVTGAQAGQTYRFIINGTHWRRDPRSARVVHSGQDMPSVIYDHNAYQWQATNFVAPPLNDLVVYELHIGTFNDDNLADPGLSNLDEAREKLDYLVGLGINAVQIMPIAEFPGYRSWGYNPSDPFAVQNRTYGGPDALKRFVDACHQRGLAVILDTVHNHYGPGDLEYSIWRFDGWYSGSYGGIYFYQDAAHANTRWGPRPNYSSTQVRNYIMDNARMWLRDYRLDGFRWDATKYIRKTTNDVDIADGISLIKDINNMIRSEFPGAINIAEDLMHEANTTAPTPTGLGYDSDWHTGFHHDFIQEATNTSPNLGRLVNRLNYSQSTRRVIYTESHDEAGHPDKGQVRVPVRMDPADPTSHRARKRSLLCAGFLFTSPGIPMLFQGQEFLETTPFYDTNPVHWDLTNTYPGILQFHQDATHLRRNSYGLTGGLTGTYSSASAQTTHGGYPLLTMHRRNGGGTSDDVFIVGNFSDNNLSGQWLDWPAEGTWYAHLNSDATKYGFSGGGSASVFVHPDLRGDISIAPWSVMVFSRAAPPTAYSGVTLVASPDSTMIKQHDHIWSVDRQLSAGAFSFRFSGTGPSANWGAGSIGSTWPLEGTAITGTGNYSITIPRTGTYRFTFNSATRTFSVRDVTPIVRTAHHPSMAVAGNFNDWDTTPSMTLNADNQWELIQALTFSWNLEFKLAAYDQGLNVSWGGTDVAQPQDPGTGTAIPQAGGNIIIEGPFNGTYRITFDDRDLSYQVEKIDMPPPFGSMKIPGSFQSWDLPTAPAMTSNGLHQWSYTTPLVNDAGDLTFRFAADDDWDSSWGRGGYTHAGFPASGKVVHGAGSGDVIVQGPLFGYYTFTFNSYTLDYSVTETRPVFPSMHINGTLTDWNFTPMASNALHQWTYTRTINQSDSVNFKFAVSNTWDYFNWGNGTTHPNSFPVSGTGVLSGNDITIQGPFAGDYTFTFNDQTFAYTVTRQVPTYSGMAVAGSFNGWAESPNMTQESQHVWKRTVELNQSGQIEFQFVAEGNWDLKWGTNVTHPNSFPVTGSANFPAAVGENIAISGPFDGIYTFTFNSETYAYTITRDGDIPNPPARFGSMAVAGTFNGWNTAPNMATNSNNEWILQTEIFSSGSIGFKFVSSNSWDAPNFGDSATHTTNNPATGTATQGGSDITVPGPFDGLYRFTFNDNSLAYRVERTTPSFNVHAPQWTPDKSGFVLEWDYSSGKTYDVLSTPSLLQEFTNLHTGISGNVWTAAVPVNATSMFYRIRQQP